MHICLTQQEAENKFDSKSQKSGLQVYMIELCIALLDDSQPSYKSLVGWEFAQNLRLKFYGLNGVNILSSTYPSALDVVSFSSNLFMSSARVYIASNSVDDPL